MLRQIILDTETTGLTVEDGHRIIEIGCVELINRRITDKYFHYYINPGRSIEKEAQEVHGITEEFLADKPQFSEIVEEFLRFIQGDELIIHNAPFDTKFLDYELNLWRKGHKKISSLCHVVDTLALARRKHPGQHNSLDALCRRYHIDRSKRDLHGALLDAELLSQVYLTMTGGQTQLFGAEEVSTVNEKKEMLEIISLDARQPFLVIPATTEELSLHSDFIKELAAKGESFWVE